MSINQVDIVDAAVLLDSLGEILELLPPLPDSWDNDERREVARACRQAAQITSTYINSGQPWSAARRYVGDEWRNALLRSLAGGPNAARLIRGN